MAKKELDKSQRNTNNLTEFFRTNGGKAIAKETSNCIFYLLFTKTFLIIFDSFYPWSNVATNCNVSILPSIEMENNQIRSLLWFYLVCEIEKSKVGKECPFLSLFGNSIASSTGLLHWFIVATPVNACKDLHLTLHASVCPKTLEKLML